MSDFCLGFKGWKVETNVLIKQSEERVLVALGKVREYHIAGQRWRVRV